MNAIHRILFVAPPLLFAAALGASRTLAAPSAALAPSTVDATPETAAVEVYRGFLAGPVRRFPRTISSAITVRIERFSTPDETAEIAKVLAKRQTSALESWLGERHLGTLQIGHRLPIPLAGAWSFSDDHGRHLVVLAPRQVSFREIFGNVRSADYPYTVAQIDLEPDGHGSGELTLAARLEVDREGHVSYEPLEVIPVRILGIRPL